MSFDLKSILAQVAAANKKTATAAFTPAQLDQMRAMLDDPSVSQEYKNNFLYVLSDAGRLSDGEIDKYAPQVGADAADVKAGGNADSNVDHASTALVAAAGGQRDAAVKSDQSALQAASNALNQGGYSNSDQIVDEGVKGLKLFADFYPYYQRAGGFDAGVSSDGSQGPISSVPAATPGGGAGAASYSHSGVDPASLRAGMDEFRGVDFTAFHADIQMLTTARGVVDDTANALSGAWGKTADWNGAAKTAAESVNSLIVAGSGALSQSLKGAADVLTKTIDPSVMKNIEMFCQKVIGLYGDGKIAGMSTEEVDNALVAKDALPGIITKLSGVSDDGMGGMILAMPVLQSMPQSAFLFASSVGMKPGSTADGWQKVLDSANTKLQQFVTEYSTKANSVHQQAAVFVTATDKLYTQMIQAMTQGLDPDPFEPVPDTGGGQTSPSSSGGDSGSTGGSPSMGGGDLPPTPPPVTAPSPPKTPDGMNPVTGQPLETNPATGQPYPIDPKTGAAIKDAGDGQETVKVQKGDNTIAMSEPDKDGKMDVAVGDGAGHQKDYKLDFGDDKAGVAADGKTDGSALTPLTAGTTGDLGPQGAKDGTPGADGTYKPAADGKIHIQDGDLKITAERPDGPGGPTVVTVDDGKGDPTAYTLDDKAAGDVKADPAAGSTGASGVTDGTTGTHHADAPTQDVSGGHHAAPGDGGAGTPGATPDPGSPTTQVAASGSLDDVSTQPAGGAYAAPGGLDLGGDLGTSAGQDSGGSDDSTTPSSEATTPAGADALGAALSSPEHEGVVNTPLAAAFNLEPGAHAGGEEFSPAASDSQSELGTAPGGVDPAGGQAAAVAQPGGMSGMMGGMGGGGGGGGGGDQQRSSSAYRVDGGIFETSGARGRISGSLDEDEGDRSVSFGK